MYTQFWSIYLKGKGLERPRRRWVYNVGMDVRDIGWEVVEWIHLAEDRDRWQALANTLMNLRVL
jgi:hypothetical protein